MDKRRFNGKQRIALYLASGGKCESCGIELTPGWHADHIEPWSRGGSTDVINGQALCPECNLKKGTDMTNKKPLRKWQREALELYDQHQEKSFLAEACPGAGKTHFIGEVVRRELDKEKADAIVIVVPSAALRIQMADDFSQETGIQLDPRWNGNGVSLIRGQFKGAVVTYQWLSNNAELMRNKISRQPTLCVLDEVHHAEDEKPWGDAMRRMLEPATKVLLTTGTPFRSNGTPIPYVNYDEEGKAIADYSYNYGKALADGIVRAIFFNHHKGEMEWDSEDGTIKATFEEKLDKKGESRRLRTSLMWNGEHIGSLLKGGYQKLQDLREDDQDAAMLVIAMDQEHAKALARRMRQELGINPIVAVSEDGDIAAGAIIAFKSSKEPCIIAVKMISEGVNIPRIRVIVYATNVVSELFFMQAIGRATRIEENHDDPTAWVFIPDDARLHVFADNLIKEREAALNKREERKEREKQSEAEAEANTLFFRPRSATFSDLTATINGLNINADELSFAAKLKTTTPAFAGAGFSKEHIAAVLKGVGFDFASQQDTSHDTSSQEQTGEKPLHRRLADLREQNNAIIARIHFARNVDYQDINNRLNFKVGIATVKTCADPGKLQRRYDLALRWLKHDIEPEAQ